MIVLILSVKIKPKLDIIKSTLNRWVKDCKEHATNILSGIGKLRPENEKIHPLKK